MLRSHRSANERSSFLRTQLRCDASRSMRAHAVVRPHPSRRAHAYSNLRDAAARALLGMRTLPRPTRSRHGLGARAALARFCGPLTPAMSSPGGAGGLCSDSKMRADFPPGRPGVISFGYGLVARHALRHRFPHTCDRLSRPRQARLRPFSHRLSEILPIPLPTGDELEPGDDLLAP